MFRIYFEAHPVAPEAVWQVWRAPYQSEIWYGTVEIWAVDFQENH